MVMNKTLRRVLSLFISIVITACCSAFAFAAEIGLGFDSVYNAEKGVVTVDVYIKSAEGIECGNVYLNFDPKVYAYDSIEEDTGSSAMIAAGKPDGKEGIVSSSFLFSEKCRKSDCDSSGNLHLFKATFKPLTDNYDINDFYVQSVGLVQNGIDINAGVVPEGNESYRVDENFFEVTTPDSPKENGSAVIGGADAGANGNGDSARENESSEGKNRQTYVILGVVAVLAIAGVALIAVKNGKNSDASEEESGNADSEPSVNGENSESDGDSGKSDS